MEENGVKLLVDSYSVDHLQGANVDYIESLMGLDSKSIIQMLQNPVHVVTHLVLNKQTLFFIFRFFSVCCTQFLKNFIFLV